MIFMKNNSVEAYLSWFTDDVDFPFFIQYIATVISTSW